MGCENCEQIAAEFMARMDRQIELLAELTGMLAVKRYRASQQAVEDGAGRALIRVPVTPGGADLVWLIERVTVWTNSTVAPSFGLYVMDSVPLVTNVALDALSLADFTMATTAVADETAPILAKGGEVVIAQWTGLSSGALCKLRLQYRQAWQARD